MKATVHFESSIPRGKVMLHAWDPGGDIRDRDVDGRSADGRRFTFQLDEMETADPREIQFKLCFRDDDTWERDAYTRRIPAAGDVELWCFDHSPRCTTRDPWAGVVPARIVVHAISRRRFAGGFVYAWRPGADAPGERFDLQPDGSDADCGACSIPVRPWMQEGFNFKLGKGDDFEPDTATRVWRPADGAEVWVKSGHPAVTQARPVLEAARVELTYSRRAPCPELVVRDDVDDFAPPAAAGEERPLDEDFARRTWTFEVFPEAGYRITAEYGAGDARTVALSLPFRAGQAGPAGTSRALVGNHRWLPRSPERDGRAKLVIHPNPQSAFRAADRLLVAWRPGDAPRTRQDRPIPGCQTAVARRRGDGAWEAELAVFSGAPHFVDLLSAPDGARECRRDGETLSRRTFQVGPGASVEISTTDGLTGCVAGSAAPRRRDLPPAERAAWMRRAFSEPIVAANVFDGWELPLGATRGDGGEILFALFAPHAVTASVLLLQPGSGEGAARRVTAREMSVTDDLRYWWCVVPRAELPDPGEVRYRFQLNGTQEVLDAASRQVTPAPYLFAARGEGPQGAWSVVADRAAVVGEVDAAPWQTPAWSELLVYELHALRFTRRNPNGTAPLPPFAQVGRELDRGRYLDQLGVTALELLPVHEFPKEISWGYNPSLHFAVESSYGGPAGLASLVRSAHAGGKAVMLDLVLNHLVESPMQEIAPDAFVDGETNWGDMLNYDHPAVREHFRQAVVSLWDTYRLDGFRLDATLAIVKGNEDNGCVLRRKGSGGGWELLGLLRSALRRAASACGRRWPYVVAENDPNDWGICGDGASGVVDGEWDFALQYPLGEAACDRDDKTAGIKEVLVPYRPLHETVRYAETHDAVSRQEGWKQRMVRREAWGFGMSMAKATGAVALLAKGIPMVFMGEEAGEDRPFRFEMRDAADKEAYCDLDRYQDPARDNARVLRWFRHLIGLRRDAGAGLTRDDRPFIGRGNKTLAFTRADGRFFVVATFGTPDTVQNLGWLGLPGDRPYKEIFNSTWGEYAVEREQAAQNGGHGAALTARDNVNLPAIGAVVLERR